MLVRYSESKLDDNKTHLVLSSREPLTNYMTALRGLARAAARRHAQVMVNIIGKQDNEAAGRVRLRPKGPTLDFALFVASF